ncbi:unnamed protein product [Rotaria magnacalcarata]|uniref:Uncharacterized protein n=1 Tax=Rotaria magnacalcarata TaxID=392030 RepID=A0A815V6Z5_9BILA|nr:unnamed protein product [Rotaria magnacalcarata]CAF4002480.1 unnamed protein product [Rotaria magnacalcarata]
MTTNVSTPSVSTKTTRAVTATTTTTTTTTAITEKITASVSTRTVITATTTSKATTEMTTTKTTTTTTEMTTTKTTTTTTEMTTTKTTTTTTTTEKMTASSSTTSAIRAATTKKTTTNMTTRKTTRKVTTTTATATLTTATCTRSCDSQQTCIQGYCLDIGHLLCALTWSPSIDAYLVVTTPTGKTIYDITSRDSSYFDGALFEGYGLNYKELDTVYWPIDGSLPPSGTYYVCSAIISSSSIISSKNPLTITSHIIRPSGVVLTMTRTFTFPTNKTFVCTKNSSYLIGSFVYP